ncbi:hypothetical protein NA57DRAFT_60896 [Rhizodiscina lignyota]|uniref:Uncharacterized protein n=1 Tax=Rhizodiscina lignyota TaxID=1504668 RepID=A0A9P4I8A8_9PEZI|nr:hypothetical protein NA57DRAFT_60896 [Rhizodiscina lignyota]
MPLTPMAPTPERYAPNTGSDEMEAHGAWLEQRKQLYARRMREWHPSTWEAMKGLEGEEMQRLRCCMASLGSPFKVQGSMNINWTRAAERFGAMDAQTMREDSLKSLDAIMAKLVRSHNSVAQHVREFCEVELALEDKPPCSRCTEKGCEDKRMEELMEARNNWKTK